MRVVKKNDTGKDFQYKWPDGSIETYNSFVEYVAIAEDGEHRVKVAFCTRHTYGKNRIRVLVLIDDHPHVEFFGVDDFEKSGEILSEIKVSGDVGERICSYSDEPIPERYAMFNIEGLPIRVQVTGVHNAWAAVANVAAHKTLIVLLQMERDF